MRGRPNIAAPTTQDNYLAPAAALDVTDWPQIVFLCNTGRLDAVTRISSQPVLAEAMPQGPSA